MRSRIRYVPDDIVIDLAAADLGHPDAYEIIARYYEQRRRGDQRFSNSSPAFTCEKHQDGSNPGLFIKKINGQWWAVHYEAATCGRIRFPAPMSDEHKRQAEYWARAAEDAGYRTELERGLTTGTRPDVLIHGPVRTGVEVQRSPMTAAGAVQRTAKAAHAGVSDIWFTTAVTTPKWAWRVPTVLNRELGITGEGHSWERTPRRRSVTAAGLRTIGAARCTPEHFGRCPYGRGHCGRFHPKPEPWAGLSVDDVASMFPARLIVPLRFHGVRMLSSRHRNAVFLVPPDSASLYTELTGLGTPPSFSPSSEDIPPRRPTGRIACQNPQPVTADDAPAGTTPPDPVMFQASFATCGICGLPLNPVLAEAGENTHPGCHPGGLSARWRASQPTACALCGGQIAPADFIRQLPVPSAVGTKPRLGHDSCVVNWASRH